MPFSALFLQHKPVRFAFHDTEQEQDKESLFPKRYAEEEQIAKIYLARYKDNLFKYETDYKHFDYKIAYKKAKIEERLEEMKEDFNENLE